jgi:hypothetical protein
MQKRVAHLFFQCRISERVPNFFREWIGDHLVDVAFHHGLWIGMSSVVVPKRKAMPSLTMLVSWMIWNEQKAGVSHNKYNSSTILLAAITREAETF